MAEGATPERARVSKDWQATFLDTLSRTSNVTGAARAARIDVSTVYRQRRSDPAFSRAWFDALCDGYDMLELDLLRRLRMGDIEKSDTKKKRKFDNATSFRLLTAHRESVGKMRAEQQQMSEEEIIASINAKLDMMRERMRQAEGDVASDAPALPAPDDNSGDPSN